MSAKMLAQAVRDRLLPKDEQIDFYVSMSIYMIFFLAFGFALPASWIHYLGPRMKRIFIECDAAFHSKPFRSEISSTGEQFHCSCHSKDPLGLILASNYKSHGLWRVNIFKTDLFWSMPMLAFPSVFNSFSLGLVSWHLGFRFHKISLADERYAICDIRHS